MTPTDPLFRQRFLRAAGLYNGALDAVWGPRSRAAEEVFQATTAALRKELGALDPRSEEAVATLLPATQRLARRHMACVRLAGLEYTVKIISGTRTYAEQDALYAQGRTKPGPVVTNAKAGLSNHNFGLAYDVGIFNRNGDYFTGFGDYQNAAYVKVADLAPKGLAWGGAWSTPDKPHFEVALALTASERRKRFEAGLPFLPN